MIVNIKAGARNCELTFSITAQNTERAPGFEDSKIPPPPPPPLVYFLHWDYTSYLRVYC